MKVNVVRTGTANLASVLAALRRLGHRPVLTSSPEDMETSDPLVLPGVGAFGAAVQQLQQQDLVAPLRRRFANDALPSLAICLGLQLLAASSAESPGVPGFNVVPHPVSRFPSTVRVPQLGWNDVAPEAGCRTLTPGVAYYANSYRLTEHPAGWNVAWTDHGGPFVGAMERGHTLACQFHPELSGGWGLELLQRWLPC